MNFRLIGIGEVLWDNLPGGRQLGGAPGNFVYHARSLGADAKLISRVGDDADGREILRVLQELGIPTEGIEIDPGAPTGKVSVEIGADGQPTFEIHRDVAWDYIEGNKIREMVASADAVCFGTLAQRSDRSRNAIRSSLEAAPTNALRILDINLRQDYFSLPLLERSLSLANVLKLNDGELKYLSAQTHLPGTEREQLESLAQCYSLKVIALTRGQRGSLIYSDGCFWDHPGLKTTVVDTVGAGDAFTACLAVGLLSGWGIERINDVANEVAAFVCSCSGATPLLPLHLRSLFDAKAEH